MGRKQEKEIIKHIALDELNKIIKREEKSVRVLERLYFIRFLYKGEKIKEACEKLT
jgi:putative transposase